MYQEWAVEADAHIAGQYGIEASDERAKPPRLVRRPVLPLGGAGPKVEQWVGCLRAAVQLGRVYLEQRRRGNAQRARATWIRAMRLRPNSGTATWTSYRAAMRRWPS